MNGTSSKSCSNSLYSADHHIGSFPDQRSSTGILSQLYFLRMQKILVQRNDPTLLLISQDYCKKIENRSVRCLLPHWMIPQI